MARAALVPMVDQGRGAVVNIASVNAFFQPDGATIDYGAAKAAVVNLTKSLAQEFGPSGIRVNAISPGPVETDLWLGEHGVAATVAAMTGVDADTARARVSRESAALRRAASPGPRRSRRWRSCWRLISSGTSRARRSSSTAA
jgi:NAD(P)-dependent dehydrogenase (short-subunit alcohol dehydrogenase family)